MATDCADRLYVQGIQKVQLVGEGGLDFLNTRRKWPVDRKHHQTQSQHSETTATVVSCVLLSRDSSEAGVSGCDSRGVGLVVVGVGEGVYVIGGKGERGSGGLRERESLVCTDRWGALERVIGSSPGPHSSSLPPPPHQLSYNYKMVG